MISCSNSLESMPKQILTCWNAEELDLLVKEKGIEILNFSFKRSKYDKNITSSLHFAAKDKNPKLVLKLMSLGASCNTKDTTGRIPLHDWISAPSNCWRYKDAEQKEKEILDLFLDKSCINEKDDAGNTPLHVAMSELTNGSHWQVVEALIKKGADLFLKNNKEQTPFAVYRQKFAQKGFEFEKYDLIIQKLMLEAFYGNEKPSPFCQEIESLVFRIDTTINTYFHIVENGLDRATGYSSYDPQPIQTLSYLADYNLAQWTGSIQRQFDKIFEISSKQNEKLKFPIAVSNLQKYFFRVNDRVRLKQLFEISD